MTTSLRLLNTERIDAVPAGLLPVRRNAHARRLAAGGWLLRRKEDGRYLAAVQGTHGSPLLHPLDPALAADPRGIDELLALLGLRTRGPLHARGATQLVRRNPHRTALPDVEHLLAPLLARLHALGIDYARYRAATALPLYLEPRCLTCAGRDRYRRPLWLADGAAQAWVRMAAAATGDGVVLEAISGFRSAAYQHGIFRRKLARGLTTAQILEVNAAPGFSEHHSGRAIDVGAPGEPPADASFEHTAQFRWLQQHAASFGFRMSYPRDNPHGIDYEPWHWCWASRGLSVG